MTLFFGLCRHQCRVVAVVGLTGWAVALLFAVMTELAAGAEPIDVLRPGFLAAVAVVLLPEVLQVVLPLSFAHALLSLEEGGELRAVQVSGVRPAFIALALVTPLVPLWLSLSSLVYEARPAALAQAKSGFVGLERMLWSGITRQGVGVAPRADGIHALIPIGDTALAVTAGLPIALPGAVELRSGTAHAIAIDGQRRSWNFDRVRLEVEVPRTGLADYTEKDLSSRFLDSQSIRWRRARLDRGAVRTGELVRRELLVRDLAAPAVGLALILCSLLLALRRPLTVVVVHAFCTPVAVAVSLFLPRLLSTLTGAPA